jgi:hypothetical protein
MTEIVTVPKEGVVYVLDANVFIEAKQRYYAFDVCPGFWDALVWHHNDGAIISIDRVKNELQGHLDELWDWASAAPLDNCFPSTDIASVLAAYADAMSWVMSQNFTDAAKAQFADENEADAWVIAFAKAAGAVVVTHEKPIKDIRRRVPIPNVCNALKIPYIDTFDLLRKLGAQFSWAHP